MKPEEAATLASSCLLSVPPGGDRTRLRVILQRQHQACLWRHLVSSLSQRSSRELELFSFKGLLSAYCVPSPQETRRRTGCARHHKQVDPGARFGDKDQDGYIQDTDSGRGRGKLLKVGGH